MFRFRVARSMLMALAVCGLLSAGALSVQAQSSDGYYDSPQPASADTEQAPGRVARLAYLSGQVQFAPAGENDWGSVDVNRPMVLGDRLLTGDDGLAVLELGDASVRIDHQSAFDFLNLDENNVQIELSQGTLNLAVRQLDDGENFEVDTPTVAFVASTPGIYRIDDAPDGTGSMVTVFQGSGVVYGENGASRDVTEGNSYRFDDSSLASVAENGLPEPDDFDRFCETRDANYANYAQQEQSYVPPDMIGGDDLYQYGQWDAEPEYGNVWYPSAVPVGWAPYRYGHWAWIDPWGWTWVDDQPWGFAPFHYGRWVHVRNRWGWMPGPISVRPVYAPALVAFIGGADFSMSLRLGGGPVGWFPLGPRDVYVPWFHASRRYFTRVNVTNIRNVYVNRTVINNIYVDYSHHRGDADQRHRRYAYRDMPDAVTAVPRDVFAGARQVHPAVLKLDRSQLARGKVLVQPEVNPGTASLGLRRPAARPVGFQGREPFARPVVARHAPPPRPVGFAQREKVIASQQGQPLTRAQMQDLRKTRPASASHDERVKLVPALAGAAAAANSIDTLHRGARPPRPTDGEARIDTPRAGTVARTPEPVTRRATLPGSSFGRAARPNPAGNTPTRMAPQGTALPSARFAHRDNPRTLPRAADIRPAGTPYTPPPGRLPVVTPLEAAPRSLDNRATQRQRQADLAAQERARAQRMQQQQQVQAQARQQIRAQQTDQQRARAQSFQVQRQAQLQSDQRYNTRQAQQARRMQVIEMQPARQTHVETGRPRLVRPLEHYTPHPSDNRTPAHQGSSKSSKHPEPSSSGRPPGR